jgi:hypothetical protein
MYSREYRIRSASTYITRSTPYWMSEAFLPFFSSRKCRIKKNLKIKIVIINSTTSLVTAECSRFSDFSNWYC